MADRFESGEVLVRVVARGRVELIDVDGEVWEFDLAADALPSGLPCTIVKDEMVGGVLHVLIDTAVPSVDGVSRFRVLRALVL